MNLLLETAIRLLGGIGRIIGRFLPFHNASGLFFFFPFYHTGGAEKVHLDIVSCFKEQRPWVFFTKRSTDTRFQQQFAHDARCFDIGPLLKYSYPLSAGILAGLIGKHPNARLFGCNALFYYLLLPHLPAHVRATDLLHGMGGGAERFALPVIDQLAQRVVISSAVRQQLLAFYRSESVATELDNRIVVLPNRVVLPPCQPHKSFANRLQVLFVGRGGPEKRVGLIGAAARRCHEQGLEVDFTLVGDLSGWLQPADLPHCTLSGPISDQQQLLQHYQQAHLIVITSSREGFPLTVMEGMAQGCVPVCTAVGGIPDHVRHMENGWLLPGGDEDSVISELCAAIAAFDADRQLLARLSTVAYQYASDNFGSEQFCEKYHAVIKG